MHSWVSATCGKEWERVSREEQRQRPREEKEEGGRERNREITPNPSGFPGSHCQAVLGQPCPTSTLTGVVAPEPHLQLHGWGPQGWAPRSSLSWVPLADSLCPAVSPRVEGLSCDEEEEVKELANQKWETSNSFPA